MSEFASNDSAVAFVTGPEDEQALTLVILAGAATEGRVIATGQNLRARFSAAGGFLVYATGSDSLEDSELYFVDLREGKSREPLRIHSGASGSLSDIHWQPARVTRPD
jgi:hypothetical protein